MRRHTSTPSMAVQRRWSITNAGGHQGEAATRCRHAGEGMGNAAPQRVNGGLEVMRTITNAKQNHAAGVTPPIPWRVSTVEALPSFRLYVQFEDGTEGAVDMSKFLARDCGVFKVLRNVETFNAAYVEHGAVTWPSELDLAPDKMHDELQKSDMYVMR